MRLSWTREEILAEHAYAKAHEVAGYRLHGGFDAGGSYVAPRTRHRWEAVSAWREQLARRGWPQLDADTRLLTVAPYPSFEQQKLLLRSGLGQTLWNSLTITGVIEGRGRLLIGLPAPDFQRAIDDDLQTTATGHLALGLLDAHGMDEGGDPGTSLGGHDVMWFAARDLVFGRDAYPFPEVPENIARPDGGRLAPAIPLPYEQMILLLMNVLMIEVRAEVAFDFTLRILGDPELFLERRAEAALAGAMIERIRTDEAIHVAYLRVVLSEMRGFRWKTPTGAVAGEEIIDPMWRTLVRWHAVENPRLQRDLMRGILHERILRHPDGERLVREFDDLEVALGTADAAQPEPAHA